MEYNSTGNGYKLKYKGKWIKPRRMTGHYDFIVLENKDEAPGLSEQQAYAAIGLITEDCQLDANDFEVVKDPA